MATSNKPENDDSVVTWQGMDYDVPAENSGRRFYILAGDKTVPAGARGCPVEFPVFKSQDECLERVDEENPDAFVDAFQSAFDVKLQAVTRQWAAELWTEGKRDDDFREALQARVDAWKLGQKADRAERSKRDREDAEKARKIRAAAAANPEFAAQMRALGFDPDAF